MNKNSSLNMHSNACKLSLKLKFQYLSIEIFNKKIVLSRNNITVKLKASHL